MLERKEETKGEREHYISGMKTKLDEWDAEIREMELNSQRLKSSVIADHQDMIDKLEHQMTKGREKMKEIIHSTDDSWHMIKEGADSLLTDIKSNMDSTRKFHHNELEDE